MKPVEPYRLGTLQLKILKTLWAEGETTIAEIHALLGRRTRLAYVTIATVLRRMEIRGLVTHRTEGRTFVYRAKVAENAVTRNLASELLDRLYGGSLAALFSNLLSHREIDPTELEELERLIKERKRRS